MVDLGASTKRWIESNLSCRVERSEPLVGGMSSDVHHVWCDDGSDFVVRNISNRAWLAREPDLIGHEAAALELLAASAVPAPRHLISDSAAGLLLMTFLPGTVATEVRELVGKSTHFAELAATIAAVEIPDAHSFASWRPWVSDNPVPPRWGTHGLWRDAIAAYRSRTQPNDQAPVLLHRDLHPLNVLWDGDVAVGVVDWVNACVGHPHAELGHCRWNLAVLVDSHTSDRFLASYLARHPGQTYDTWWDIAIVLSFLPDPIGRAGWLAVGRSDLTAQRVIASTERFLAGALEHI